MNSEDEADDWRHAVRYGDDTPPVFASVRDDNYSRGSLTSQPRTASPAYVAFLQRHKEVRDGR